MIGNGRMNHNMSEPIIPAASDEAYRPLSGLALGGFLMSSIFAGLVLFSAAVGLVKGAPIFYPLWILLFAIIGFALCYSGMNQINNSEGTRSGMWLARYGMGMTLFAGLGYAAYYVAIGMAVARQADEFLMAADADADRGFFQHVVRGGKSQAELNIAFLQTLPAPGRAKIRPDDEDAFRASYDQTVGDASAGNVSQFRSHYMVRMLGRASGDKVVESLGVRDWTHEKSSYKVSRNYLLRTPEAELDMTIFIESSEAEVAGQHRKWFVNFRKSITNTRTLTPLGKAVEELSNQARSHLEFDWIAARRNGVPVDIDAIDKTDWKRLFSDTQEFMRNGHKNVYFDYYPAKFRQAFQGEPNYLSLTNDQLGWITWDRDEKGRLRLSQPCRLMLQGERIAPGPQGLLPNMSTEGYVKLRTTTPVPEQLASPAPPMIWEVVEINILRAKAAK